MSKVIIPKNYKSSLNLYETQIAIEFIKETFENFLKTRLNLKRISAPLFLDPKTGLNDNLNGIEKPVSFKIKETNNYAEIVHSLAKWKRFALYKYGFKEGEGIYTDMNAIRCDEEMSNIHSIYVDQWDFEKIISNQNRNLNYLKNTASIIINSICDTLDLVKEKFPKIQVKLSRNISFISTQELEDMYPDLSPKMREDEYLKKHKTAVIMKIGDKLKSGQKHDGRSPDYDDWKLNGDILFWNDLLNTSFEISSLGIRVDKNSLDKQLKKSNCDDRRNLLFHKLLLNDTLPLTIGGGIGQSRVCMLLLGKAHIGEVQVSIWDKDTYRECEKSNIKLL